VFATNIGSSATVVGNPVGVLLAMRADLSFIDFIRWATPISIAGLAVAIPLCLWYFKPELNKMYVAMKQNAEVVATELSSEHKKESYLIPWIIFLGTIGGLIVHSPLEEVLGLEKNALLPGTAFAAAGIVLFLYRDKARELVERRVDWWTLAFFLFLFASVGTMKMLGITTVLANAFVTASGGDDTVLFFIFTPIAAVLSAFMDNVLAVATLIPVVHDMGTLGVNNYPFWWAMLFAGTFFGNLTLIGSTANIVAIGMLERRNGQHITLKQWIKPGAIISIPTMILAMMLLFVQIPLMPSG
jgi:Na+/H+ antiporter NhaD/arsenite permease-like protein